MENIETLKTIFIVFLIVLLLISRRLRKEQREQHKQEIIKATQESLKRSKSVIRAQVSEEVIPLIKGFPYEIGDLKLFAKPVDFVVFDGMSELRDGNKEKLVNIVFADVKTGKAVKTNVQKAIKEAIENGRIRFEEWRIDANYNLTIN